MITQAELKSLLSYDPETGIFRWQIKPTKNISVGSIAGCSNKKTEYICIRINRKLYQAHRLAWLYVTGEFPTDDIDHINRVRNDNRIINLREATASENLKNARKHSDNMSGVKGVCLHKQTGKWRAESMVGGKKHHLGLFITKQEASAAYQAFAKKHHGEFYYSEET